MTEEQDLQLPINQALLEEAQKLKQERALIKERIEKIEAKKNDVSPTVYQKVKQDYSAKLNEATEALLEKKTDIDRELSTLYETRTRVNENLEQHREALEELKFRHELGEHDKKQFTELSGEENEKIGKFEKVLAAVTANIERYEAIFSGEEDIVEGTEPSIKKPKARVSGPISGLTEGSDYNIDAEENDYFSPEAEGSHTPIAEPSSVDVTKKSIPVSAENARVIVIEGEMANNEFQLRKETTIGRANTNTIVLKDSKVSRQHAVIRQTGNEFIVIDLNSSNGVIVNHERVKEHVLTDGDQFTIGDHTFQFKL